MGLDYQIERPENEQPKRKIEGFGCKNSEVSGRRLWGYFQDTYPTALKFFEKNLVINYCPLVWMKDSGANITPDKIKAAEMQPVEDACQRHLVRILEILQPGHLIGVGAFAEKKLLTARDTWGGYARVGRILYPSPASPAANRGWADAADVQLKSHFGIG